MVEKILLKDDSPGSLVVHNISYIHTYQNKLFLDVVGQLLYVQTIHLKTFGIPWYGRDIIFWTKVHRMLSILTFDT